MRAAVVRYQAAQDAIQDRIEEEGGPASAHEHDSGWNRLADRQERAGAWLCILLEKRGRPEDVEPGCARSGRARGREVDMLVS